jgi:serine/threonine-protein kinase
VERLGKYEIIAEIGRGAMGAVYKARDPLIGRLVAVKTITTGLSAQANSLERFYQEARSAGALQHPNIITIYELGQEKNTPYIAMEYIEGGSLDHFIEQRQILPLSVKLGYIVRVCEALYYAHRNNVVHRDIKPGNIMVTKEGVVKVVDFGIARLTDMSLTQPNMMIGSRAYMSPQLYKGERADARADIWAVGVTLYELLAYQRPFNGDSEAELMYRIMTDNPPTLPSLGAECSDELAHIIHMMLEKKAEDRYQSMEDVLRDLEPLWKSAQQSTVAGLLADSQSLVDANDLQRAQALLRKALQIDVANTQAKSLLEKVTSELRRSEILPKLNEHLDRGRSFLHSGQLREARREAEAALGLDSRHESAQLLFSQVEAAAARVQEVEQKLRLTKQRLAEGALTEAAAALGIALQLDAANPQAQELRRQIDEESNRREKRKKLSEVLHHARTLWTALSYEDCLSFLSRALKEYPNESELLKLQEMARHDLEDLQKQRQLGEVRKLLGQQEFGEARKMIEALAKKYPQDSAVMSLQAIVLDSEREQQKSSRFTCEIAALRTLLSSGKLSDALVKGEVLLREYPEEFELKELVDYAREELAQQEQRQKEKERERQIRGFLERESYKEAETTAKRAVQEFPKLELFRKLAEEAGHKRRVQEQSEHARLEMQRRVEEIRSKLSQEKISDAFTLAQQTIVNFGPDPNVTQLLQVAATKLAEHKKKEDQDHQIAAAQSLIEAGNFAGATQVLNQAMATQIFERSDSRVQQQLRTIEELSASGKTRVAAQRRPVPVQPPPSKSASGKEQKPVGAGASVPPGGGSPEFSATLVGGPQSSAKSTQAQPPSRANSPASDSRSSKGSSADSRVVAAGKSSVPEPPNAPGRKESQGTAAAAKMPEIVKPWAEKWPGIRAQAQALLRKPAVLAGVGGFLLLVIVIAVVAGRSRGPSEREKVMRDQAVQLWKDRQFDRAEQSWRQLEQLKGFLQTEARRQLSEIQQKRESEKRRFAEGESFKEQKNYSAASQAFQDVTLMNLWLVEEAQRELALTQALGSTEDIHNQEKLHFDQGEKLYESGDFEKARKEFQTVTDLNITDSTLRPQADNYLKKMRQAADARKLYESALADIKNENWAEAHHQLQELVNRKGAMSGEAKQRLADVTAAQKGVEAFNQSLQAGAYRSAKSQLDNMRWPKTKARLLQDLQSGEQLQAKTIENRARSLQASSDLDGLERLQGELHNFVGRVEDADLVQWAKDLDKWLVDTQQKLREKQGDRVSFDAAVTDFNTTKEKGDLNRMSHEVLQKFQKIAKGSGAYRDQAQTFLSSTIPAAMQEMAKTLGAGKMIVPPIVCAGGLSAPAAPGNSQDMTCAKLDADVSLQWLETPTVEFPSSANQPGKLPYTLRLIVTVEANGKVKIDKDGNVDKDFFKKAKDASRNWKATVPKSGGKPVRVSFPLAITFQK